MLRLKKNDGKIKFTGNELELNAAAGTYTEIIEYQVIVRVNLYERKSLQNRFIQCSLAFFHGNAEAQIAGVAADSIAKELFGQLKIEGLVEASG